MSHTQRIVERLRWCSRNGRNKQWTTNGFGAVGHRRERKQLETKEEPRFRRSCNGAGRCSANGGAGRRKPDVNFGFSSMHRGSDVGVRLRISTRADFKVVCSCAHLPCLGSNALNSGEHADRMPVARRICPTVLSSNASGCLACFTAFDARVAALMIQVQVRALAAWSPLLVALKRVLAAWPSLVALSAPCCGSNVLIWVRMLAI